MATLKTCFKCKLEKPRSEFYAHPRMGDGLLGKCKQCTKRDVTKHRGDNVERIREYDRRRGELPHRIAANTAATKSYRSQHPKRARANAVVNKAVSDGRLKKQPCWVCGEKALAHHPDYDRPLDVVWLCQPHHKAAHAVAGSP